MRAATFCSQSPPTPPTLLLPDLHNCTSTQYPDSDCRDSKTTYGGTVTTNKEHSNSSPAHTTSKLDTSTFFHTHHGHTWRIAGLADQYTLAGKLKRLAAGRMVSHRPAPRAAPRGPAAQRRAGMKADRDGDVAMGISVKGRSGGISKSSAPPTGPRASRPGARGGLLAANAQREILRQAAGTRDVSMKDGRVSGKRGELVELKVTGWDKSKASTNSDGGVSSLITWLEKKASNRLGSRARSVKIKKSSTEGTDLIVKVASEDVGALLRMDGYGWAGITVKIERIGGPVEVDKLPSSEAEKTKAMLRSVLERRYDHETKFLNLSALGQDDELKNQHIFDQKSTASKFFPAMMRVLELSFDKPEEKDSAITSVSLANNDLTDLTAVTTLSQTLPKILNLDLSNNKFEKLDALQNWRRRFHKLQHLILTGNPLEQNQPNYHAEVINWFKDLRQLNGVQVRTEEDIANRSKTPDLPFPIRSAHFQDEGGIAEQFIRTFFAGFDSDRATLALHYYDNDSEFSYAVNTSSLRDPSNIKPGEAGEWEGHLRNSRNLRKITQLPARQARKYRGTEPIAKAFASMPATKHPDLTSEARKWMVEAKMIPGIPDPSGASPTGVDGFLITVYGEFEEAVGTDGQASKKRSFDRTFILGPGGAAGVRIVSDQLTLRAYGGFAAFEAEHEQDIQLAVAAEVPAPALPAGLDLAQAGQMVAQLVQQTGMTVQYAKDCLEQVGWQYDAAVRAFEGVKANLPAEAFGRAV